MLDPSSVFLLAVAGCASLVLGFLQFVLYFGSDALCRAYGAPPWLIDLRADRPNLVLAAEILIALMFWGFAAYAFSGLGLLAPLPWLAQGLAASALVYLLRGLLILPQAALYRRWEMRPRDLAFSFVSILVGCAYALPSYRHWLDLVSARP